MTGPRIGRRGTTWELRPDQFAAPTREGNVQRWFDMLDEGTGAAEDTVGLIARRIRAGGVTYDPENGYEMHRPGTWYAVTDPKYKASFTRDDQVYEFLGREDVRERLMRKDAHVGGWVDTDTGEMEINVTDVIRDKAEAMRLGAERGEKEVGELHDGRYVRGHKVIPGYGLVRVREHTRGGRPIKAHTRGAPTE